MGNTEEAVAEALRDHPWNSDAGREATAKIVVGRYLDALLGDIPAESVEAAWGAYSHPDDDESEEAEVAQMKYSLIAFLRSLREDCAE